MLYQMDASLNGADINFGVLCEMALASRGRESWILSKLLWMI